jgi:hypothetical protein
MNRNDFQIDLWDNHSHSNVVLHFELTYSLCRHTLDKMLFDLHFVLLILGEEVVENMESLAVAMVA